MTKSATGNHPDQKLVNPAAAAIDIGSTMHIATLNPDACDTNFRAFGTFTQAMHDLADWFEVCSVTSVAMESTGVCSILAFEVLEARGFHEILAKARYAKNMPGCESAAAFGSASAKLFFRRFMNGFT
jgi:transposase